METIINDILHKIRSLAAQKEAVVIAIDGRCASGKTTLTSHLQQALDCNVIHMDHFFLRPKQRTADRLLEPGGNIDYERFLKEVLLPLSARKSFSYRPFHCSSQSLGQPVSVNIRPVNIIEGSYSCHPLFQDYYDLKIFLTIAPDVQMTRILHRNGEAQAADFRTRWIPLEEQYLNACRIEALCDLRYSFPQSNNHHPSQVPDCDSTHRIH